MPLNIDRYRLPEEIAESILKLCQDIESDVIATLGVSKETARELVAMVLNKIAWSIHEEVGREQADGGKRTH